MTRQHVVRAVLIGAVVIGTLVAMAGRASAAIENRRYACFPHWVCVDENTRGYLNANCTVTLEEACRGNEVCKGGECIDPGPGCGNAVIEGEETCDDGNVQSGDGCSRGCVVEDGWICHGEPTSCVMPAVTFEQLLPVQQDFNEFVDIRHAGDERLFIVGKRGKIFIYEDGALLPVPFLDIGDQVVWNEERGLLGMVFHPAYETNGRFYVDYTKVPDGGTVISEFLVSGDPNVADPASERIILEIEQPGTNHNGGSLQFGSDGYLYIGMGDGGTSTNGQDIETLLGTVLRIDVNSDPYGIPADNPFVGKKGADEIYAYGLRNPWRFSFDSGDRLYLGDVGQSSWEEIDLIERGKNYGWRLMEGSHCFPPDPKDECDMTGLELPIYDYAHTVSPQSVTGGYVYEGKKIPELMGSYIYADFGVGKIWALHEVIPGVWANSEMLDVDTPNTLIFITTFGKDMHGEVYFGDFNRRLFKIQPID